MHSSARDAHDRVAVPIARTVRRLRAERGWTLDQLAARSGISRRLVIQIEQAQANPSVRTLLRLADAFELTLSELLPAPAEATSGVRPAGEELELWSGPRGGVGYLLVSRGPLELWSWVLRSGESQESEAHRPGALELLTVKTGTLQLELNGRDLPLKAGDSAWFDATEPHAYRNPTRATTEFILAVFEP
jgi:transcriptional regulator with XRE-family HTH domain